MTSQNTRSRPAVGKSAAKGANGRIARLEREIATLNRLYKVLRDSRTIVVPIATFDPEPYELCNDILVVVQPDGESFIASFFDANINASGNTQADAVANLKDIMIAVFEALKKEKKLAKGPARQLAILQSLMRRKK